MYNTIASSELLFKLKIMRFSTIFDLKITFKVFLRKVKRIKSLSRRLKFFSIHSDYIELTNNEIIKSIN
jgi:hypothetical protein